MFAGVSTVLRAGALARALALEPASSPALTAGTAGPHRVEAIATGIVPPLLAHRPFDEARTVDEAEARRLALPPARWLVLPPAPREGVLAGTSGALNVAGALRPAREAGAGRTAVASPRTRA